MIEEMRLRSLGVIEDATLPLGAGFTAITGETGAGKTMVVTGLGLLLGDRADSGAVRAGAAQAVVEGRWVIPAQSAAAERARDAGGELEPAGEKRVELLIARSVTAEGRSRATVGGRSAPAGVLADLAEHLVVVHGQSEQLRLRSAAAQRDALDRYAGAPVLESLDRYRALYSDVEERQRMLREVTDSRDARAEEAARLRRQLTAIAEIDPQPGEDAELALRAQRLAHVEQLREAAAIAHAAMASDDDEPDAGLLIAEARRALDRVRSADPALEDIAAELAELGYRLNDLAASLAAYLADLDDAGPQELAAVEERRALLAALIREHGSLDAALEIARTGAIRLDELSDDDALVTRLSEELQLREAELDRAAAVLTDARRAAATRLGDAVTEELRALALPDARLLVEVSDAPASAQGRDGIRFLLAPHPGAEPRPLARTASGGELSRVMLALEVVIAATDPVPTFIFDEVDAGIGGAAAIEVGRRLQRLAESAQVIAVTHLAQVAAFAHNHLSVIKATDGAVTASDVRALDGAEREAEMARLLSGMPDSQAALTHARELLGLARAAG